VKLVLEGIAAPHHVIESYWCGELATCTTEMPA
jgi:hypothetical protein